jgi:hypothetical protein
MRYDCKIFYKHGIWYDLYLRCQHFPENVLGALFIPKVPLEAGAAPPPTFWCFLRPWAKDWYSDRKIIKKKGDTKLRITENDY